MCFYISIIFCIFRPIQLLCRVSAKAATGRKDQEIFALKSTAFLRHGKVSLIYISQGHASTVDIRSIPNNDSACMISVRG